MTLSAIDIFFYISFRLTKNIKILKRYKSSEQMEL